MVVVLRVYKSYFYTFAVKHSKVNSRAFSLSLPFPNGDY